MAAANNILTLDGLGFSYAGGPPILRDVSFELAAGERMALFGPNGSGKTTLLHLVVGLLRPTAGRLVAFGAERTGEHDFHEVRRRIGLVFQDPDDQLFCPTVAEDVAFGPLNLGLEREEVFRRVSETLEQLDLVGYEDRVTYKLSTGERRRVCLATVMSMRPDVLLLDEPTANLDGRSRKHLLNVLGECSQGMLLVTHDTGVIRRLCSRVVALAEGQIVADGSPEVVLCQPQTW